jgi:uncharacterized membrane protein YedE/YeeE
MKRHAVAFLAGGLFALGLALSGMTRPSKVLGFLDLAGRWDPSLLLVMVGAIAVYATAFLVSRRMRSPILAETFAAPPPARIDGKLLFGAALFGIGWGVGGYCPGPALTTLGAGVVQSLYFVAAMIAGTFLAGALDAAGRHRAS